jgi:hypothetical protein
MARGIIEPPNLDDRKWQDIVAEATALIPYYNPEWTDHNRTDLGITLVELFAWLVEGMTYRLNRVPEKNFIEFLNLLGITRDPQTPATTLLTYRMAPTAVPLLLPAGHQVATVQTETEPAVVFETDEPQQLLPINLVASLDILPMFSGFSKYFNITKAISAAPLAGLRAQLLPNQLITVALGFDRPTTLPIGLRVALHRFAKQGDVSLQFFYSSGNAAPGAWPAIPGVLDGTAALTQNGFITTTVPAAWGAQNPTSWAAANVIAVTATDAVNQPLYWIGIRVLNASATAPFDLDLKSILINSVHATSALTVTQPELLGTSTGAPFQVFYLRNVPMYEVPGLGDPYRHLIIEVRQPQVGGAFGPWAAWTRVEDLPRGAANVYRLDPVSGAVSFGNFDAVTSTDGHGSIPANESEIRALTYRYVAGGDRANVAHSTVNVIRVPATGVIAATNPLAAANGADEESIEDAKRRGPETLRNRFRAVTAQDYEYLARESTTEVKKVRCLEPRHITRDDIAFNNTLVEGDPFTYGGLNRDTGDVNVIIIPDGPVNNRTPTPSDELLREVTDYLQERRTITAALTVTGPKYLPIRVTAQIRIWRRAIATGLVPDPAASNQVRDDIVAKIMQFLHPTRGNLDGKGWQIGEDQTIAPLFEFIQPPTEVGFIQALTIQPETPLYLPTTRLYPATPGVWVKFADFEMVCSSAAHAVTVSAI